MCLVKKKRKKYERFPQTSQTHLLELQLMLKRKKYIDVTLCAFRMKNLKINVSSTENN